MNDDGESMEKNKLEDAIEAFSWWPCDATENHRRHYQSHWLQANLSEMEEKIHAMVRIIEEDGDSFAKRAEMLRILDDFHRSYRCLAGKYDQTIRSSSSSKPEKIACMGSSCIAAMQEYVTQQVPCKSTYSYTKEKLTQTPREYDDDDLGLVCLKRENGERIWGKREASELIEDHLRHQAELVKRNEEKRVTIKALRSQMKKLMAQNEAELVKKDSNNEAKGTLFRLSKLTGCS